VVDISEMKKMDVVIFFDYGWILKKSIDWFGVFILLFA